MNTDQIALQLYTVREHTARDMLGTLRQVADMGYRAVELAGYGNASAQNIRATLDECGMRAVSAHVPFNNLLERPQHMFDELTLLGCAFAVVPSVGDERRRTAALAQQFAADLNRLGALARDAGLRFGYHNHAFEFAPLDNTTLWDVLVTDTDPALVALELDVFWAKVGGHDPTMLIEQLRNRVPLLHLKDMAADDPRVDLPVGDGVLPWADIMRAGAAAGTEYYIVEQDNPRDALNDVRRSFDNLQRM